MMMKMKLEEIYCLLILLKVINFYLNFFFSFSKKKKGDKIYPNAMLIVKKNISVLRLRTSQTKENNGKKLIDGISNTREASTSVDGEATPF